MRHAAGRARFRARRAHGRAGPHGPCPMSTARPRPTARASGRGPRTRRPRGLRAEGGLSLVQDETRRCSEAQSYGRCHGAEQRDTIAPTHDARRLRRAACPQYSRAVRAVVTVNRPVSCARTHDMQLEHTPKCGWRAYACTAHVARCTPVVRWRVRTRVSCGRALSQGIDSTERDGGALVAQP